MRWAGHVVYMGQMRNAYNIFVGKPDGNRSHGKHRRRWEDAIGMDLREVVWGYVWYMHLVEDRGQWWAHMNKIMILEVL
jgi:hypothetical protein